MFCENEDCDKELSIHQVADGECFCSDECGEEALRVNDSIIDYFDSLFDSYDDLDDEDDE
jgi:hypothetical protein